MPSDTPAACGRLSRYLRSHLLWRLALALAAALILGGLFLWQWQRNPAHQEIDISQERLARAAPGLLPGDRLQQTILCRYDGFQAIELTLVRYRPDDVLPDGAALTLEVIDVDTGETVARSSLPAARLEHNQRIRFSWAALVDSEGTRYRLVFGSVGDHALSFWASGSEAYAEGALSLGDQTWDDDLVMTTFYRYELSAVLRDGWRALSRAARPLGALLLLGLPGLTALLYLVPAKRLSLGTGLALILACSLAFWPLALLWTSAVDLRLGGWLLWVVLAVLAALVVWRLVRFGPRTLPIARPSDWLPELALVAILLLTVAARWLQVREMLLPNWVDSVHHTLITQLIVENGLLPAGYAPYVTVDNLHYHFGFHANAALLCWVGGMLPHEAVLYLGQLLNGLAVLVCYALASRWSGRRWAGVGAALVAGLVCYMPSYYVSWGRYTQLAGLVILPGAMLAADWLWSSGRDRRAWFLATLLIAGLGLTHYRVLVFFALWWLCRGGLALARGRLSASALGLVVGKSAALLGLCLLAVLPWLLRFASQVLPMVGATYGGMAAAETHDNSFPLGLLKVGWSWGLLCLAGAGAGWSWLRGRWRLAIVPLWCGLVLLSANLHWLGLPDVWLVHNLSVVISFWLPVSVLCGWVVTDLADLLTRGFARLARCVPWRAVMGTVLLVGCVALGAWRGWYLVDIVNRVTMLVNGDDMASIAWIAENLPAESRLLVNNRKWQGELRVGTDAGYWIPLLAQRRTNMPPVVYYQGDPAYREAINALAGAVEAAESADDPNLLERLARNGFTHVYVGWRGGKLEPKWLDDSAHFELIYQRGATRVYAIRYEGP